MPTETRSDVTHGTVVGTVTSIFRFPIKSVGGRPLERAFVGHDGVLGDRRYAFVDLETGNLCNAKHPRKFGRMLACRAYYVDEPRPGQPLPPLEVAFPDGSTHRPIGARLDDAMSSYLDRAVRLVSDVPAGAKNEIVWVESAGLPKESIYVDAVMDDHGDEVATYEQGAGSSSTFFDLTPLHVVTTSTIEHFRQLDPAATFDARRYRPTMVIESPLSGLVEETWIDRSLSIGDDAVAGVVSPTPRCVMSTIQHDTDLPVDRGTLRTIVRHNTKQMPGWGRWGCLGVYADVRATGMVRVGDPVRILPHDEHRPPPRTGTTS